jgi:hypothetical protein
MVSSHRSDARGTVRDNEKEMHSHNDHKVAFTNANLTEKATFEPEAPPSSHPPIDHGIQAWLFLAGCYVMEMLVFGMDTSTTCLCLHNHTHTNTTHAGFGFSFGVFQDYYSIHAPFAGSGGIAVIGTLTTVRPTRSPSLTPKLTCDLRASCSWVPPSF